MTEQHATDLKTTLDKWSCPADLCNAITAIAATGAQLADSIANQIVVEFDPRAENIGTNGLNGGNDVAQALDVYAHDLFIEALVDASVRAMVSEEAHGIVPINSDGDILIAIDPLDGSSNISINAPLGTIFSLRRYNPAEPDLESQFLDAGRHIVAAGYIMYGPSTVLVLSTGSGVATFTLDQSTDTFRVQRSGVKLPGNGREFAINVSNYRHWDRHVQAYITDLIYGIDGGCGADYNTRWVAALVAECHRVLTRGGIFLYPGDNRTGYQLGRLRLLYEAHPIGFLIEQAGGAALDGIVPVLDRRAATLHDRTPLVFGEVDEVQKYESFRDARPFMGEMAPLFSSRGLFRS